MLKGIPSILSPGLLKILMEMGHGDELVIGDGNFPAESCGKRVARLDGHGVPEVLDAVLRLFPLDSYVEHPMALMQASPGETVPEIWNAYEEIVARHEPGKTMEKLERFAFYDRARQAYAVIATGETAVYANIILKKGVVPPA